MKRILAFIGIGLLVLLYVLTIVFALMKSPESTNWFKASIMATIAIPCLIYAYQLVYRVLKHRDKNPAVEETPEQKITSERPDEIDDGK